MQDADAGDTTTSIETLIEAAEQVEAVRPDGEGIEEVVGDKGYHSNQRWWISKPSGFAATSRSPSAAAAIGGERRGARRGLPQSSADSGRARQAAAAPPRRAAGTPFAHLYDTGGMRRMHLRGHTNILKRVLIHAGGFNLGLLMRRLIGVGTPRGLQGRRRRSWLAF